MEEKVADSGFTIYEEHKPKLIGWIIGGLSVVVATSALYLLTLAGQGYYLASLRADVYRAFDQGEPLEEIFANERIHKLISPTNTKVKRLLEITSLVKKENFEKAEQRIKMSSELQLPAREEFLGLLSARMTNQALPIPDSSAAQLSVAQARVTAPQHPTSELKEKVTKLCYRELKKLIQVEVNSMTIWAYEVARKVAYRLGVMLPELRE